MAKSSSSSEILNVLVGTDAYADYLDLLKDSSSEVRLLIIQNTLDLISSGKSAEALNHYLENLWDPKFRDSHEFGIKDVRPELRYDLMKRNAQEEYYDNVLSEWDKICKHGMEYIRGDKTVLRFTFNKGPEKLEILRNDLNYYDLLDKTVSIKNFRSAFATRSDEMNAAPVSPIRWIGTNYQLRLILSTLWAKENTIISTSPGKKWETTINCFRKATGDLFEREQLERARASDLEGNAKMIKSILQNLS